MTREEQIIEAGIDYTMSVRPMCVGGLEFEEDIRKKNRNKSFEEGAKWADKTMIDKACDYLYKLNRMNFKEYGRHCPLVNVSDFRKAMEMEEQL